MTTATEIPATNELQLLPKQMQFVADETHRKLLYSGAFAAGKSYATCVKCAVRASVPGAREGLCRKHRSSLTKSTLLTLLEGEGGVAPVLPKGSYTHNKTEGIIRIHGGGSILYFGLDDVSGSSQSKIGSLNLTGCGIDEWVELSKRDTVYLNGRCRVDVPGLPNQMYGACNPGPPSHYLAEMFGLALGHEPDEGCFAIRTRADDNFFLKQDYLDDLARMQGIYRKRFFEGLWVGSEGLIYDNWNPSIHVKVRDSEWVRSFVTVDEGAANPFVALLVHEDEDGRLHVAREFYYAARRDSKPNLLTAEKVKVIRELGEVYEVCIDPSAAQLIAECRAAGLNAVKAVTGDKRNVFKGIQRVQARLGAWGGEADALDPAEPGLTVDPACTETIREFETYEWNESASGVVRDEPRKEHDHALDALRYLITRLDATGGIGAAVVDPSEARRAYTPERPQESVLSHFRRMRENPEFGFDD